MSLIHKIPLSTRQGTGLTILWYKYEDYKYQISCKGRLLYQRPALTHCPWPSDKQELKEVWL